jgi:hypothetical protein
MMRLAFCLGVVAYATSAVAQTCDTSGMAVQILGSGGPRINRERASTSYLVWLDRQGKILVDAGGGAFLRFGQAGGNSRICLWSPSVTCTQTMFRICLPCCG